jgi:hypothetical protein
MTVMEPLHIIIPTKKKSSIVLITEENGVLCEFQIESGHFYQELLIPSM